MSQGLLHLHNFMRWVVLIMAVLTLIRSAAGLSGNKTFTGGDRKTALFLMISCDIQLLVGLALYFMNGWAEMLSGGAAVMKDKALRFFAVEHMMGMLIAIILIHIGYSAAKKNIADGARFRKLFWFTLIGFLIMLATIPWPFREAVGRPWFPGMH